MSEKKENLILQIIAAANFKGDNNFELDKEMLEQCFITSILNKKIKVFELPIKITNLGYLLIEIYSEGNPAFGQYILAKILETKKGTLKEINVKSIVNTWPFKIPNHSDEDFAVWWTNQKIKTERGSMNAVDTKEFWLKFFV